MKSKDEVAEVLRQTKDEWPEVAIIVLNWNNYKDTAECLKSLEEIDYPNYDVFVVDNGSTDDSAERLKERFGWCEFVFNEKNLGFTGGCNVGIEAAIEDGFTYVILLNNDSIATDRFIEPMVTIAESDDSIGIIGNIIRDYDDPHTIQSMGGSIGYWTGRHIANTNINFDTVTKEGYRIREVDYVSGACLMASAELIKSVGPLDEEYFIYTEEIEWCERAREANFRVVTTPDSVIYHRIKASYRNKKDGENDPFELFFSIRNNILLAKNYTNKKQQSTYSFVLLLRISKHMFNSFIKRHNPDCAYAVIDALIWHIIPSQRERLENKYIPS